MYTLETYRGKMETWRGQPWTLIIIYIYIYREKSLSLVEDAQKSCFPIETWCSLWVFLCKKTLCVFGVFHSIHTPKTVLQKLFGDAPMSVLTWQIVFLEKHKRKNNHMLSVGDQILVIIYFHWENNQKQSHINSPKTTDIPKAENIYIYIIL